MRILVVHNHYGRYAQGGEANVMNAEARLLRDHGHQVMKYERTNAEIYEDGTIADKLGALRNLTWSERSYREINKVIQAFKPDVMHVHNYKWLLSPSIFAAAKDRGVATVHTLHNYWMCAPCAALMRQGVICEKCLTKGNPAYVLFHRCRKEGNLLFSLLNYLYFRSIERRNKLADLIDGYIALTPFAKQKYILAGLPPDRIFVKPNGIADPLAVDRLVGDGGFALFIGRLSYEKGLQTLLDVWNRFDFPLQIAGDGPLRDSLKAASPSSVQFIGSLPNEEALDLLARCTFFVFPSIWYEGFPLSLLEATALGKASVATRLGARGELVEDGVTGHLYDPTDSEDLARKLSWMMNHRVEVREMGNRARKRYLKKFTPEKNYQSLMPIYETARDHSKREKRWI
ncbi:MAG: glycosyltransferase family 4 protein [Desulforhabdus sp.]|jgi:glycosyltransferase involved in cell wall biosynthesis|nr:glycosyltransferase family 4 protein [Desulforhabdus sp.]